MRKTVKYFALACVVMLALTACSDGKQTPTGGNSSSDTKNSSTSTTSSGKSTTKSSTGSAKSESKVEEEKPPELITVGSQLTSDGRRFVPETGAKVSDDIELGKFIINDAEFDIADPNLTLPDVCDSVGSKFGYWDMGYNDYEGEKWLGDKAGYYIYCGLFSTPRGGVGVHFEALDKDGNLLENAEWKLRQSTEENLTPFDDLEIKAVRFEDPDHTGYVLFTGMGLEVGRQPKYYEEFLGKGYEVEVSNKDNRLQNYMLSIYKNSYVTLVIEYRKSAGTWYNECITVIKND